MNKIVKKIITLCLLTASVIYLYSCTSVPPNSENYTDRPINVFHLQDATAAMVQVNSSNEIIGPGCTVFFIGQRRLATALHCVRTTIQMQVEIAPGLFYTLPAVAPVENAIGNEILFIRYQDHIQFSREYSSGNEDASPRLSSSHVVAIDVENDLAILDLSNGNPDATSWLTLNQGRARVGERVYAIGFPRSQFWIITSGIVSADRHFEPGPGEILHTAQLNHGNSGGPLIDNFGQVVGINSAIVTNAEYIGVSIPVEALRTLLTRIPAPSTSVDNPPCAGDSGVCDLPVE